MSWNLALQFNKFASITRVSGNDILIYNATGTKLASYKTTGLFLGDADAGGSSAGGNNLILPSYGSLTWGGITATPPSILSGGGTNMYYRAGTHYIQNTAGSSKGSMDFAVATYTNSAITVLIVANSATDLPYHINNNNASPSYYLPDARITPIGNTYTINNNSSNSMFLYNNTGATLLYNATAGSIFQVVQLTNATQNGTWDIHAFLPSNVNWGTAGCSVNGNFTLTGTHDVTVSATGKVNTPLVVNGTSDITLGNAQNTAGGFVNIGVMNNASNSYPNVGKDSNNLSIGWNKSGGDAEIDFFNSSNAGFNFYARNSSTSITQVARMRGDNVASYAFSIGANAYAYTGAGSYGTSVGVNVGNASMTGGNNTLVGYASGQSLTNGYQNTCIGSNAGGNITSGASNTTVGNRAGRVLSTANNNILIGQDAGYSLTTQGDNVLIGVNAGYYLQTATATGNVVVGHNTQLTSNATLNNTYVGSNITGGASVAGEIVIGSGATGLGTNTGQFGNSFTGVIRRGNGATTTWDIVSDMRIKENIVYLQDGLSKILLLKPARFDYKTIDEKNYVGFIAQDYEQVFPEQIKLTEPVGKEAELVDDKVKNISSNLNPYFVLAIQEQHA